MNACKFYGALILVASVITTIGCGSPSGGGSSAGSSGGGASMDDMAGVVDQQNAARQQAADAAAAKAAADQKAAEAAAAAQPPERKVAGRESVEPGGYANAIIGARRHILNKVESLAWVQAVQHFQATEGRLPKDHAEFMSKIVVPLDINLGYLPEGQEFFYDPKGESDAKVGQLYYVDKAVDKAAEPAAK